MFGFSRQVGLEIRCRLIFRWRFTRACNLLASHVHLIAVPKDVLKVYRDNHGKLANLSIQLKCRASTTDNSPNATSPLAASQQVVTYWRASVKLQTPDVFEALAPELELVEAQLRRSATVDFPLVSTLIQDIVKGGGKRLRPILLLLASRAFNHDQELAVTAAAGVELLHTASLVHDDNIDRASLRRGQPTLNNHVSSGAVILIGDFLFAQSAILAAATNTPRVVTIFATSLAEICDGQIRETLDAHRLNQTRADYDRRIYGKTAALFAGAAEMGAVIGSASSMEAQEMRQFGTDLGMAFQIIDDVLDLREGTTTIGKPAGNDLRQGVIMLPTMIYLASISPEEQDTVERIVTGDEEDSDAIDQVVNAIRESGALEEATHIAWEYARQAESRLDVVKDSETRRLLTNLLYLGVDRSV